MLQAVRDVRYERLPRFETFNHIQSLIQTEMGCVRTITHRIHNQSVQSLELFHRFLRNGAYIRHVGEIVKTVSEDGHLAMHDLYRAECHAVYLHIRRRFVKGYPRLPAPQRRWGEDITENAFDIPERFLRTINGYLGTRQIVKPSYIIHAEDVVRMRMGDENRIHAVQTHGKRLQTKLRRGVHDIHMFAVSDGYGGTSSLVMRVGGCANGASTPDHWHAVRRPRTENDYLHANYCTLKRGQKTNGS